MKPMTDEQMPPLPGFAAKFRPRWDGDEGGYTADQMFAAMRAAVEARDAMWREALEPMTMALCERHSLVLRVGQPYVFRPVGDCESCAEMAAQAREAYGPSMGDPTFSDMDD